jgi:hypothetical protein
MKIRVVKTASKASAVQIVKYQNNKRIILQHVGSAHNELELKELMLIAQEKIKDYKGQLNFFPEDNPNNLLHPVLCGFENNLKKTLESIDFIELGF